jgi:hypothetical protein
LTNTGASYIALLFELCPDMYSNLLNLVPIRFKYGANKINESPAGMLEKNTWF